MRLRVCRAVSWGMSAGKSARDAFSHTRLFSAVNPPRQPLCRGAGTPACGFQMCARYMFHRVASMKVIERSSSFAALIANAISDRTRMPAHPHPEVFLTRRAVTALLCMTVCRKRLVPLRWNVHLLQLYNQPYKRAPPPDRSRQVSDVMHAWKASSGTGERKL